MTDARTALLDAALEEFSRRGFAGARVRDIAARAGVSKDLIGYHFGTKLGLYEAVQEAWIARRDGLIDLSAPLARNVDRYLSEALRDPRPTRMAVWLGLADDDDPDIAEAAYPDFGALAARQATGEVDPDLDAAVLELVLVGAVSAPGVFPALARRVFGMATDDPAFEERYRQGLLRLVDVLRGAGTDAPR
jgi:AcrR family transcriptional regulator